MNNKKLLTITAAVLMTILVFASCTPKQDAKVTPTPKTQQQKEDTEQIKNVKQDNMDGDAYKFELTDVHGNIHKLADYKGKKVYIKFWATSCPICLSGMSEFMELDEKYKDNEDIIILTMVAPNTGSEMKTQDFKDWYAGQKLEIAVLLDEGADVFRAYGIRGVPISVFIDSHGDIYSTKPGHQNNQSIEETLDKMA